MARTAAAAEQLRIAEEALAARRFLDAAEILRKLVGLDRDSPRPQLMLAYALWQAQQRNEAARQRHEDLPAALALLSLLDDYVAVSNTNVHLNDGLGKRTRVLVTTPAEWRWCLEGERSPWFAQALLYRQRRDGVWDDALARLEVDLART